MHLWHPHTEQDLLSLLRHCTAPPPRLLGHLRWCLHTPQAHVLVARAQGRAQALATVLHHGDGLQVLRWLRCHPAATDNALHVLLQGLLALRRAAGQVPLVLQALPADACWWQQAGFVEQAALETWEPDPEERFAEAERAEVVPLEAVHSMALLRLHHRATGQQHTQLLLEHSYASRVYATAQGVHGVLLPLLGDGLIVADHPAAGLELQRWLLPAQAHLVVPEGNRAAAAQLEGWGYCVASTSLRLVLGTPPPFRPELIYAWPWP
ncbi:MAG: hypothetical protein KF905_12355 [Flavobacteriales bacterium]|nr:hypothetical protein [Flavobacteriales bacterium]